MIALMALAAAVTPAPAKAYRMLVPMGDRKTWFRTEDYPSIAVAQKAEGIVRFAVQIGADGMPTACRIMRSSGNAALDGATCKALMARARFHPLIDGKGRPTTATFDQVVRWKLPRRSTEEMSDRTFTAHSVIGPTGDVVQCTMTGSGSVGLGQNGNDCGPFGERSFLSHLIGRNYAKVSTTDVRLQLSYEGMAANGTTRTPDFYLLLAEAEISVDPNGSMGKCTSVRPLELQGRNVDLCEIVGAPPPRFQPGALKKRAIFVLDLSASYR
jgi:TonB family protein